MAIQLILLRHGIAVEPQENLDDFSRELTAEGMAILEKSLSHLRSLLRPAEKVIILSSPRVRAVQTARIAARLLDLGEVVVEPFVDHGLFGDLVDYIAKEADDREKRIVIVGHEPTLGYWTGMLCGHRKTFSKGEAVSISLSGDIRSSRMDWAMNPEDMMRLSIHRSKGDARLRETGVLAARFADLTVALRGYSQETDQMEAVHRIRTTSRRAAAALALYRPILCEEAYHEAVRLTKTIGKSFSHLRDADVLLSLFEKYRDYGRKADRLTVETLANDEEMARRVSSWRASQVELLADRGRLPTILRRLEPLCAEKAIAETFFRRHENATKPFDLQARLMKHREHLKETVRKLDAEDDKSIHEFRTLVRRLRYMEELLLPEEAFQGERLFDITLADLQDSLGQYCDAKRGLSILSMLGFSSNGATEEDSESPNGFISYLTAMAEQSRTQWRKTIHLREGI
jgi:phosphohistidine phosphatase SixA/CHAD domain-containing protein